MHSRHICSLLLLVVTLPAQRLLAESDAENPAARFADSLEALEVQVPIQVLSREGEAVRGLILEDFQLVDNGRRQELQSLQVIDLDAVEPGWIQTEIDRAVPAAARRHFLLLFDLSFSSPSAVVAAREGARRFVIEALHPTDLVAVAVHTVDKGPKLLVTFTSDRGQVARAIDIVGAPEAVEVARHSDPLSFMLAPADGAAATFGVASNPMVEEGVRSENPEVQGYLDVIGERVSSVERSYARGKIETWSASLESLARSMNSVQGRKVVVYFSEGFDSGLLYGESLAARTEIAGQELTALQQSQVGVLDTDRLYGSSQTQGAVDRMLREFRRADCVVEVVDISSLTTRANDRAGRGALFYVANETGGEVREAGDQLDAALRTMLRRSSVTYLLTYQPARLEADGSYHRLRVRADLPPGARLTYREGYYAPKPWKKLHPLERDLLTASVITGGMPRRDVAIDLLAEAFRASDQKAYVPVVIEVSGDSLIAGHEQPETPIEIYAYATDQQGAMRDFFSRVLMLDLEPQRDVFEATGLKYYGHFELPAGSEYLIRVLVRNAATGRTGTRVTRLLVPEYGDHAPILLVPFFVESAPQWFMVREVPRADQNDGWVVYPFMIRDDPFVPAAHPRLHAGEQAKISLFAYNLGVEAVDLRGRVLTSQGDPVRQGSVEFLERVTAERSGIDQFLIELQTEGLIPGDYRIEVQVEDPSWRETVSRETTFSIVAD